MADLKLYVAEFGKISTPLFLVASTFDEALTDAKKFATNGVELTSLTQVAGRVHIDFSRETTRNLAEYGVVV